MDQVLSRLWIGDADDGRNPELLKANGITAVMNATMEADSLMGQFAYLRLNQSDGEAIPEGVLGRFLAWMGIMMANKHKVLIHCGAGISRAASFTICWLMEMGMSWDEAEALVRAKRPQINPSPVLKRSILKFYGVV